MNQTLVQKTTSPKAMVGALLAFGSLSAYAFNSTASDSLPYVKHVYYEEETNTPKLLEIDNKMNRYKEAKEVVPVVRDFNEEEILKYNKSLDKLFKPIGVNIFDL